MPVIPVDLTKTGGKLIPPGMKSDTPPPVKPVQNPPTPPPAAATVEKEADKKDSEKSTLCPHCRLDTAIDPVKPTSEDEAAFVRAVWRGEPFRRTISLYGGAVSVSFRTLDADEEDAIRTHIETKAAKGEFPASFHGEMTRYELAVSLHFGLAVEELRVGDKVYRYAAGPVCDPVVAHAALKAAAKSQPVYAAAREAFLRFTTTAVALQTRAADPSFPSATAVGG